MMAVEWLCMCKLETVILSGNFWLEISYVAITHSKIMIFHACDFLVIEQPFQ